VNAVQGDPSLPVDVAAPVRSGEEVDVPALRDFLRGAGVMTTGQLVVSQFPRGYSNLTYLLEGDGWSGVLRRPPRGVGKGVAHDVVREARLLLALGTVYPKVPRVLALCEDPGILGAPFYVMGRARGIILRDRPPDGIIITPETMRRISAAAVDTLAEVHSVDYVAAGLASFGRPAGYVERQVTGWTRRYAAAANGAQPELEEVATWLGTHLPPEGGAALVHNDFKYDNLVLDPDDPARVLAVLDWEMATIGDPALDVGTTLAYWVESGDPPALRDLGLGMTTVPGNLTRRDVLERYAASSGREVQEPTFCYAFGLFKVAVIAQQILARFVRGDTSDPRFARLDHVVRALGRAGADVIAGGRI